MYFIFSNSGVCVLAFSSESAMGTYTQYFGGVLAVNAVMWSNLLASNMNQCKSIGQLYMNLVVT